jgi:NADPH-dependent 2,4-dienoyl-CoA reductase/sulfur reductase-like enzyme
VPGLRLLVIGGSDAGISAGLRARELDPSVEVTLLVADAYPNFSICGLPYYLSGDVGDWRSLAHRTRADLQGAGLQLLLDHTAHAIDPAAKQVTATDPAAAERQLGYVTLVEQAPAVMPTVDPELGQLLGQELRHHGLRVVNDVTVKAINQHDDRLVVAGEPDFLATADLVLVVVGVRPDTDLAVAAGVERGVRGALRVDRHMRTNQPDVLAAGDCVETWHRLLGQPAYLPLGTTAHKQGRIAGATAVGGTASFAGSLGTQVVKVFDLAVARTGLRDYEAQAAGFDPVTVGSVEFDHKAYYPGAHQLHLRITGDRSSGRLLGAQLLGDHRAQVAKRVDIPATALFHGMTVEGLSELDLSYTPPFGSPWNAVQMAAQTWTRQAQGGQPTQAASHETR